MDITYKIIYTESKDEHPNEPSKISGPQRLIWTIVRMLIESRAIRSLGMENKWENIIVLYKVVHNLRLLYVYFPPDKT